MPKKTKKLPSYKTTAERFRFYLKHLFGDNQRKMAQDTSLSQAVISKIVLGKQDPGGRVLKLLSLHPKVNPAWLISGEGEPLLAQRKSHGDQGWPVPIVENLLPGPPAKHPEMLTGQMELVAGANYRESAYIYILTSDIADESMLRGDRILLDANPQRWRCNLRAVDNKLCAIRRQLPNGEQLELRRLFCEIKDDGNEVKLWASGQLESTYDEAYGKEKRFLDFREEPVKNPKPIDKPKLVERSPLNVECIVAIAVHLTRVL